MSVKTDPTAAAAGPSSFSIFLPEGFIELPSDEPDLDQLQALAREIAALFGAEPDGEIDQGLAETTAMLAATATAAASAAGRSSFTAAGFFRSPDDSSRPIMALINCFCLESDSDSIETTVAGLQEVHRHTGDGAPEVVELPAGTAVLAQATAPRQATVGETTVEMTEHSITAWIANPTSVVAVAVTSNNTEDWDHVADMSRGIFETFEWQTDEATAEGE
ncbi:MAG: hypothetical protein ACRDQ5_20060 [Sciscionella sp.]